MQHPDLQELKEGQHKTLVLLAEMGNGQNQNKNRGWDWFQVTVLVLLALNLAVGVINA